jgi:Lrp/AsnC family leucine-responsive transcriptional regulator
MKKEIDLFDERMIKVLVADGRISNTDLAERVGLSATPCWNRLKRLTDSGVIQGYRAVINWAKLGRADTAVLQIEFSDHSIDAVNGFCSRLILHDWVLSAQVVTGEHDIEITVVVDGTSGLDNFLRTYIYSDSRVKSVHTRFIIRSYSKLTTPTL